MSVENSKSDVDEVKIKIEKLFFVTDAFIEISLFCDGNGMCLQNFPCACMSEIKRIELNLRLGWLSVVWAKQATDIYY